MKTRDRSNAQPFLDLFLQLPGPVKSDNDGPRFRVFRFIYCSAQPAYQTAQIEQPIELINMDPMTLTNFAYASYGALLALSGAGDPACSNKETGACTFGSVAN